jgi:hypothetical protein
MGSAGRFRQRFPVGFLDAEKNPGGLAKIRNLPLTQANYSGRPGCKSTGEISLETQFSDFGRPNELIVVYVFMETCVDGSSFRHVGSRIPD